MSARRRICFFALMLILLSACASKVRTPGDADGLGGTGITANNDTDGIGGTGLSEPNEGDADGIGGTGLWASAGDVALYGVVTDTDPLTINGHSLLVDTNTTFSLNGNAANAATLQRGSVAWVKAGLRDTGIFANNVMLQSQVLGPIEFYDETNGLIRVLGQNVTLPNNPKVSDSGFAELVKTAISSGGWLEVSGMRRDASTINASLISIVRNNSTAFVRGFAEPQGVNRYRIGNLSIDDLELGNVPEHDVQLLVSGAINSNNKGALSLQTRFYEALPALPFVDEVAHYSVQGYFSANNNLAGFPRSLKILPTASTNLPNVSSHQPVVLELKPGSAPNTLNLLRINRPNSTRPGSMLIPQYKPQLPSGEFTGNGGMSTKRDDSASTIPLQRRTPNAIDKTTVVPNTGPNVPAIRPDVSVGAPVPTPQIRTAPPADIVRPQIPDAQPPSIDILPGSVGPR